MALITPELVAMARVQVTFDPEALGGVVAASYEFSNGFESVSVHGNPPIFIENRSPIEGQLAMFLSEPVYPGEKSAHREAGIKAEISLVSISTPENPLPPLRPGGTPACQYGDYSLAGTGAPYNLPSTPYAKVDPLKVIRVAANLGAETRKVFYLDVSVFRNPMTIFK